MFQKPEVRPPLDTYGHDHTYMVTVQCCSVVLDAQYTTQRHYIPHQPTRRKTSYMARANGRGRRTDGNHTAVVEALRRAGATVQSLAMVGYGCPDLLWAFSGTMGLMEVKNASLPPSRRRLTDDERAWHAHWAAPVDVVETPEQAVAAMLSRVQCSPPSMTCTRACHDCGQVDFRVR